MAKVAAKQIGADLAPLLEKSIAKARERRAAERLWLDDELEPVHEQVDEEIWRARWRGLRP